MAHTGAYKNSVSKYIHEYMFWKKTLEQEGALRNGQYETFFTTLFGLDKAFYDGKRILDIGCGPCGSLEWADNARKRVGLDPLAEAYQYLGADKHHMEYTPDFAESISFPDGSFDVVTSINSLDHVDSLEKVIAEIGRVLADGGHALIACEVSLAPKACEPTLVKWDLAEKFPQDWQVLEAKRFPFVQDVSTSILTGQPLPADRHLDAGVLRLVLRKPG